MNNVFSYVPCNGLSNQLIHHAASIARFYNSNESVTIPDYFIINGVQTSDEGVLPEMGKFLKLSEVFDISVLESTLKSLKIDYVLGSFETDKLNASCTDFSSLPLTDASVVLSIIDAFHPSNLLMPYILQLKTLMFNSSDGPNEAFCFHHRSGIDWKEHCARWSNISDGVYRGNCLEKRDILTEVLLRGIGINDAIYFCGDDAPPPALLTTAFNIVRRIDVISDESLRNVFRIPSFLDIRDLQALIDFFVCKEMKYFIGNSVSTFSALQIAKRKGISASWYNSQSIPLGDIWRIYHLSVVYMYRGKWDNLLGYRLQISILSVIENMPMSRIFVFHDGNLSTMFIHWLNSKNVEILFLEDSTPTISLSYQYRIYKKIIRFFKVEYLLFLCSSDIVLKPIFLNDFGLNVTDSIAVGKRHMSDFVLFEREFTAIVNVPYLRRLNLKASSDTVNIGVVDEIPESLYLSDTIIDDDISTNIVSFQEKNIYELMELLIPKKQSLSLPLTMLTRCCKKLQLLLKYCRMIGCVHLCTVYSNITVKQSYCIEIIAMMKKAEDCNDLSSLQLKMVIKHQDNMVLHQTENEAKMMEFEFVKIITNSFLLSIIMLTHLKWCKYRRRGRC